ncbi:MAG: hypothetical protein ACE37F_14310 [Nannocystaceae bacterium]|nr:hypothetical protein [bacterium]
MTPEAYDEAIDFNPCARFGLAEYEPGLKFVGALSRPSKGPFGLWIWARVHLEDGSSEKRRIVLRDLVSAEHWSELKRGYEAREEWARREAEAKALAESHRRRLEWEWVLAPDSEVARATAGKQQRSLCARWAARAARATSALLHMVERRAQ